jgi:hypothetical protein
MSDACYSPSIKTTLYGLSMTLEHLLPPAAAALLPSLSRWSLSAPLRCILFAEGTAVPNLIFARMVYKIHPLFSLFWNKYKILIWKSFGKFFLRK